MNEILTMIPARGGSKGVPRKNIRDVAGKPLIAWTIEAALNSCIKDSFFVSTDDQEIADISTQCGAPVQMRPLELAGDRTPMIDAIRYAFLENEKKAGKQFEYFLLLQPTAPMRTAQDIDDAIQLLQDSDADSVVSVYCVEDTHPARMYLLENDSLKPLWPEPDGSLRQDLPDVYHRNGAIYACTRDFLLESGKLWGGRMVPHIMPKERSANIDDEADLKVADLLLRQLVADQ